jgi:DNA polymerase-1
MPGLGYASRMATVLPDPGAPNVLYVVDLSGYVFRAYHAIQPLSSPRGEPTHATFGTVSMLGRLLADRRPERIAVAMDSKTGSFRRAIDPRYKANRPPPPPDLSIQMARAREIVDAMRIAVWQHDSFEADDIIATAVRLARERGLRVVVVSADKDLMQLVGDDVLVWDSMRNKVFGPPEVEDKFGVPPDRLGDLLALMGDPSDNVPGVKSVGPKTAAELLRQFASMQELYAHLEEVQNKRLRAALDEQRAEAELSRTLVTLREDVPLPMDLEQARLVDADAERLRALYAELGFHRLLDALGSAPAAAAAGAASALATSYTCVLDADTLRRAVEACARAGRFAFDTETTSTDSMRAALVGVSLCCTPGEAWYVPVGHRYLGAPPQLGLDEVRAALAPLLEDPAIDKVGHNLKFDQIVLLRNGLPRARGRAADTMVASYLLDPEGAHGLKELAKSELGVEMIDYDQVTNKARGKQLSFEEVPIERATEYAAADADMTLRLAHRLLPALEAEGLLGLFEQVEIPLGEVLADMEMAGVLVDTARLASLGAAMQRDLAALEHRAKEQAGHDFNINSPRQLETVLFDELGLRVVKRTKTARSTDASVLEALADEHPLAATILEQRQLAKLKNTYIDTLPELVHPETGRIHTRFNQTVAATGRLSSSDPTLQNIPVRTELGRAIREAFVASEGHLLVSADYSQIELRVLAHLAGDPVLVEAFRSGEDVHTRTAMEVFGVWAGEVSAEQRRSAKTINFGVIYGMGEVALAKRLGIAREQAASFIEAYFARYQGVRRFMDSTLEGARAGQGVRTLLGRRRHLRDLGSANRQLRAQAERMAGNTPIQGTAADILKLAMNRLREPVVPGARMILTVHDELVFEIPAERVEVATPLIREAMQSVVRLSVPLTVEVGVGRSWAEAH